MRDSDINKTPDVSGVDQLKRKFAPVIELINNAQWTDVHAHDGQPTLRQQAGSRFLVRMVRGFYRPRDVASMSAEEQLAWRARPMQTYERIDTTPVPRELNNLAEEFITVLRRLDRNVKLAIGVELEKEIVLGGARPKSEGYLWFEIRDDLSVDPPSEPPQRDPWG